MTCQYAAAHRRVARVRGRAKDIDRFCANPDRECNGPAEEWALDDDRAQRGGRLKRCSCCARSYSTEPYDYSPYCRPCNQADRRVGVGFSELDRGRGDPSHRAAAARARVDLEHEMARTDSAEKVRTRVAGLRRRGKSIPRWLRDKAKEYGVEI